MQTSMATRLSWLMQGKARYQTNGWTWSQKHNDLFHSLYFPNYDKNIFLTDSSNELQKNYSRIFPLSIDWWSSFRKDDIRFHLDGKFSKLKGFLLRKRDPKLTSRDKISLAFLLHLKSNLIHYHHAITHRSPTGNLLSHWQKYKKQLIKYPEKEAVWKHKEKLHIQA